MVTITLAVPAELKTKMELFPEINWSEVARQAFTVKIGDLEFLKKFKSNSRLTEEDALRMGKEVGRALTGKLKERAK